MTDSIANESLVHPTTDGIPLGDRTTGSVPAPQTQREVYGPNIDDDPRIESARDQTELDVAALIVNKMIGTGIFTGPSSVLLYTHNKSIAIGLWVLGFAYTLLSMMMYLEFARQLPYTGGELIYLDDLLRSRYRLWAYTLYAFYFVFVYTTCTNAMQFANQVLLAARSDEINGNDNVQRLMRFLAVTVTTAVCLLLYVSDAKSRLLNKATAFAKVLLLVIVIGFGANYLHNHGSHYLDWMETAPNTSKTLPARSWQSAFITVLFSFHGWENATLVAGEIPSFKVLKRGFRLAVITVGCLYLTIVCLLCAACDWESGPPDNFAASFFGGDSKDEKGKASNTVSLVTAIVIALSAFGSMLSVAYTGVRVKQTIGWANVLPGSAYWRRSAPVRATYSWQAISSQQRTVSLIVKHNALTHPGTPEGGIVLHWIATVVYICITATFDSVNEAINFSGTLLVFGHFFVEGLVGLGFVWFDSHRRMISYLTYPAKSWYEDGNQQPARWMRRHPNSHYSTYGQSLPLHKMSLLYHGRFQTIIGLAIFAFSVTIVIAEAWSTTGRVNLWVMIAILGTAWLYWFAFVRAGVVSMKFLQLLGIELQVQTHGVTDQDDVSRFCEWCPKLQTGHRHPREGYYTYNNFTTRRRR